MLIILFWFSALVEVRSSHHTFLNSCIGNIIYVDKENWYNKMWHERKHTQLNNDCSVIGTWCKNKVLVLLEVWSGRIYMCKNKELDSPITWSKSKCIFKTFTTQMQRKVSIDSNIENFTFFYRLWRCTIALMM